MVGSRNAFDVECSGFVVVAVVAGVCGAVAVDSKYSHSTTNSSRANSGSALARMHSDDERRPHSAARKLN